MTGWKNKQLKSLPEISLALFAAAKLSSSSLVRLSLSFSPSSAARVQSGWPWLGSKPSARFLLVAVPTDPSSSPFTSLALFSSARRDCETSTGGPHRWSTGTLLFAHVGVTPAETHRRVSQTLYVMALRRKAQKASSKEHERSVENKATGAQEK